MKAVSIILKVLTALAAVAGIVYVFATYGDKIVAWAKNLLNKCQCLGCDCDCDCEGDCDDCPCEEDCDACPCDCECECDCEEAEEVPAEEVSAEEPAEDSDFEG